MKNGNEQEIIDRNRKYLAYLVSDFMRRCTSDHRGGMIGREDLTQEITLCFLLEVRQYGEDEARKHRRTLFHAMYEAARRAYPVTVSYHAFGRLTMKIEPWEDMAERIITPDRVTDHIDARAALEELTAEEKQIVSLRLQGWTQREIARAFGWTDCAVSRRMARIRRQMERIN